MNIWKRAKQNSLWLVGFGLMLASSGLDGMYMAKWMPVSALGLVLNTMSDIASLVLMYWYGRLKQSPRGSKRNKLAGALLPAELVAALYSWFFSWRQLRVVLPAIEPEHWQWVAPIAAGFIPLLLAFIGYAQSLLAGKLGDEPGKSTKAIVPAKELAIERVVEVELSYQCSLCDRSFGSYQALNGHMRAHSDRNNGREAMLMNATKEANDG